MYGLIALTIVVGATWVTYRFFKRRDSHTTTDQPPQTAQAQEQTTYADVARSYGEARINLESLQQTSSPSQSVQKMTQSASNKREKKKMQKPKPKQKKQLDRRGFGEYRCSKCNRFWMSSHSWVDKRQECQTCGTWVYPHDVRKLIFKAEDKIDPTKAHPRDKCEMCRQLGYFCGDVV